MNKKKNTPTIGYTVFGTGMDPIEIWEVEINSFFTMWYKGVRYKKIKIVWSELNINRYPNNREFNNIYTTRVGSIAFNRKELFSKIQLRLQGRINSLENTISYEKRSIRLVEENIARRKSYLPKLAATKEDLQFVSADCLIDNLGIK